MRPQPTEFNQCLPRHSVAIQAVFKKTCAPCHRLDREGTPVGPDLFGIRNQPKEAILLHILVPEHEITPGFTAYIVTTKEGRPLETGDIAGRDIVLVVDLSQTMKANDMSSAEAKTRWEAARAGLQDLMATIARRGGQSCRREIPDRISLVRSAAAPWACAPTATAATSPAACWPPSSKNGVRTAPSR